MHCIPVPTCSAFHLCIRCGQFVHMIHLHEARLSPFPTASRLKTRRQLGTIRIVLNAELCAPLAEATCFREPAYTECATRPRHTVALDHQITLRADVDARGAPCKKGNSINLLPGRVPQRHIRIAKFSTHSAVQPTQRIQYRIDKVSTKTCRVFDPVSLFAPS